MTEEQTAAEAGEAGFTQEQLDAAVARAVEEATSGLKAKNDELLGELKGFKSKAREAAEEAAKKSGNIEELEKSWRAKLEAREAELASENERLAAAVQGLTVGAAAKDIASELAVQGSASVLERIIRDRLTTEMGEDGPKVRVLSADGRPSASTLDDLKEELRGDAALKPIIAGTRASGGGAAGANGGAGRKTITRTDFSALSPMEQAKVATSGARIID